MHVARSLHTRPPAGRAGATTYEFPVAARLRKPLLRSELLFDALSVVPRGSRIVVTAVEGSRVVVRR